MMGELKHFRFWCYKVLPLVYDDSLSYYEVLCKVVNYINKLIEQDKVFGEEIEALKEEVATIKSWIDNLATDYIDKIIGDAIATMIFVESSNAGYFIYYIPENWNDITFNTTGLDIIIPNYDYGRLVLSY